MITSPDHSQWHLAPDLDDLRARLLSDFEASASNNPVLNSMLIRFEGAPFAERLLRRGGLSLMGRTSAVAALEGTQCGDPAALSDVLAPWASVSAHGTQLAWIRQVPTNALLSYWSRSEFFDGRKQSRDFVSEDWFERSRLDGRAVGDLAAELCSRVSELPQTLACWGVAQTWSKLLAVCGDEDDFESAVRFAHSAYDCGALSSSELIRVGRIREAMSLGHAGWHDLIRRGNSDRKRLLFEDGGRALCQIAIQSTDTGLLWAALDLPLSFEATEAFLLCAHQMDEDECVRRLGTSRLVGYILPRLSDAALQTLVEMENAGLTHYENGALKAYANRRRFAPIMFQPPGLPPQYCDCDARRWDALTSVSL